MLRGRRLRRAMRAITLAGLILALLTTAQADGEACSMRETVYPSVKTAIVDDANFTGRRVRFASAGERLDIIGSTAFGAYCWLQVSDGWVRDSAHTLSSQPPDTATAATSAAGGSCYRAETAFVTGNMNIRSRASTSSSVVAKARAGDEFAVASSRRGMTWCWLKISEGWLANTSRVQSTKPARPAAKPVASQAVNVDNCCFIDRHCESEEQWKDGYYAVRNKQCSLPTNTSAKAATPGRPRLEGSRTFIQFIESTLDLLEARTTHWYRYVVDQTSVIIEGDPYGPGICGAHVHTGARRVTVDRDCQTWSIWQMAPILVHEACHVHHHDRGITYPEGQLREEWECGKPPLAASKALGIAGARHMPWDEFLAWMSEKPFD